MKIPLLQFWRAIGRELLTPLYLIILVPVLIWAAYSFWTDGMHPGLILLGCVLVLLTGGARIGASVYARPEDYGFVTDDGEHWHEPTRANKPL